MNKPKNTPTKRDITSLFQDKAVLTFSSTQKISPQLKQIIKANPKYRVSYLKRVRPSIKKMRNLFNLNYSLRGRGWTRPVKDQSKKKRKMAEASRKRNRQ